MGLIANQMLAEWCARLVEKIGEKKREHQERKQSLEKKDKEARSEDQGRG